jgi:hypothetical protein
LELTSLEYDALQQAMASKIIEHCDRRRALPMVFHILSSTEYGKEQVSIQLDRMSKLFLSSALYTEWM